jgi:hypothetical protein
MMSATTGFDQFSRSTIYGVHMPAKHATPPPLLQGVESGTFPGMQPPVWQVPVVQSLPSPSVQPPASLMGVTEQVGVPLQARVLHSSPVQVMAVPPHVPAVQTSVWVHAMLSSQVEPSTLFGFEQTPAVQVPAK